MMRWDIYKQLKPIEREWYKLNHEDIEPKDIFNLWFLGIIILALMTFTICGVILAKQPGFELAAMAFLNLQSLTLRVGVVLYSCLVVISLLISAFLEGEEKRWLKELGYETMRRK